MRIIVFTGSPGFADFIEEHLHLPLDLRSRLGEPVEEPRCLHLLHLTGQADECFEWLQVNVPARCKMAALCSDRPDLREMLEGVRLGIKAYCNSYMAAIHYRQMLQLLDNGQSWRMTESEGVLDLPGRGDTVTIRRGAIGGYRLDWGNVGVRVARTD